MARNRARRRVSIDDIDEVVSLDEETIARADAALAAAHAGTVDDAPVVGFAAADVALKRWEASHADITGALGVWLREKNATGTAGGPSRREQIEAMTYDQLLEDRPTLDRVLRSICNRYDCDYSEAIGRLEKWKSLTVVGAGDEVSVADLFTHAPGGRDLDTICLDVVTMEAKEAPAEVEVQLLDSSDPDQQVSSEDVDDRGRVRLPAGADRAHLLTDQYTIERAWLKARDLAPRTYITAGDNGVWDNRERFEADYRGHIEAGADLVATLEAQHRADEAANRPRREAAEAVRQGGLEAKALARRRGEERRQLEAEIAERQERLEEL